MIAYVSLQDGMNLAKLEIDLRSLVEGPRRIGTA
jgi:hypothetical protein